MTNKPFMTVSYKDREILVPYDGHELMVKMDDHNYLSAWTMDEAKQSVDRFISTGCWFYYH